jgi:hypothetical protein
VTRIFLTIVLPLVLPAALYVAWAASIGRAELTGTANPWRDMPWTWLLIAGAVLVVMVVIVVVQFGGAREGTYVAPHVEKGVIVPGHVEPAPNAAAPDR